ncbi:gp16 family protein [Vibrio sp.]|uniref:gp16 family protein n=1 Tax=Vibrio sp. TaxID=678 RepID=UPI003AA816DC
MSAMLKMVQIGKRQLNLDDDVYRNMLEQITGQRSCKGLSDAKLKQVIDWMKTKGFKVKRKPRARAEEVTVIRAIWITMHQQGFVRNPKDLAIDAYCKRMTQQINGKGVERANWMNQEQAAYVLEALKKWHYRLMEDMILSKGGRIPSNDSCTGPASYSKLAAYYLTFNKEI